MNSQIGKEIIKAFYSFEQRFLRDIRTSAVDLIEEDYTKDNVKVIGEWNGSTVPLTIEGVEYTLSIKLDKK